LPLKLFFESHIRWLFSGLISQWFLHCRLVRNCCSVQESSAINVCFCVSATTRNGNDLLESIRHSSWQSGTPSLSVSVSTSTQPHLPAKVFAGYWGDYSPQSATSLPSESINTSSKPHFSASSQTGNRLVNNRWAFVATFENHIVIGVRIAVYYSTATHTGHVLFKVLGAFVDTIGGNRRYQRLFLLLHRHTDR
jgi:hypothetical protein